MRQAAPPSVQGKWPMRGLKKKIKEPKGFGSTACRFRNSKNTNPGPAYYHDDKLYSLEAKGPSYSKKGFGPGFISTGVKIQYPQDNGVPGPAAYKLPELGEGIEAGIRFGNGTKKSYLDTCYDKAIPGPNAYPVKDEYYQVWSHYMKDKPMAAMCSKSNRESFLQRDDSIPGVGEYNVDPNANTVQKQFAWSKSKTQRNDDLTRDNGNPGPGSYFQTRPLSKQGPRGGVSAKDFDMDDIDRSRKSLRSAGSYRGKYLGKQNERRKPASHTFGADKDRFKNSFCGRLDLAALIPGPGAYKLPDLGQGMTSGIKFVQSGNGRRPYDMPEPVPGPAYYSPKCIVRTAQCQNMDGRWV